MVSSIAIFRALQLGDLLCSVPALRALRTGYPAAHITLIGLPWARVLVERYAGWLDDFIEFPGAPGLPEREPDPVAAARFGDAMRSRRFDLLLQMHGSGGITNPLLETWGAGRLVAYHTAADILEEDRCYLSWDDRESEVLRQLRLAVAAGGRARGTSLDWPVTARDREDAAGLLGVMGGEYVCIHPGARYPSRRWPIERFAAVADALASRGYGIVLTGTAEERALTQALVARIAGPLVDLTGRTTLASLAAIVAGARLVVCNDTGMSHIAVAVGTPSVVVASGSDVARWRPLDGIRHHTLAHAPACRPCMHTVCPTGHECARAITVDQVLDAVSSLPLRSTAHAA